MTVLSAGCSGDRDGAGSKGDGPIAKKPKPPVTDKGGPAAKLLQTTVPAPDAGERPVRPVPPPVPLNSAMAVTQPKVVFSDEHAKTCLVQVGDEMPQVELPNTEGDVLGLVDLYGQVLTVVVLWTSRHPYAKEQFERLSREVVTPYEKHGVNVVAINRGDSVEEVQRLAKASDATFPNLVDSDAVAFQTIATSKLPRTYLLDPAGKILWLDIEYSESTRRELRNAILWHLKHDGPLPKDETL